MYRVCKNLTCSFIILYFYIFNFINVSYVKFSVEFEKSKFKNIRWTQHAVIWQKCIFHTYLCVYWFFCELKLNISSRLKHAGRWRIFFSKGRYQNQRNPSINKKFVRISYQGFPNEKFFTAHFKLFNWKTIEAGT